MRTLKWLESSGPVPPAQFFLFEVTIDGDGCIVNARKGPKPAFVAKAPADDARVAELFAKLDSMAWAGLDVAPERRGGVGVNTLEWDDDKGERQVARYFSSHIADDARVSAVSKVMRGFAKSVMESAAK